MRSGGQVSGPSVMAWHGCQPQARARHEGEASTGGCYHLSVIGPAGTPRPPSAIVVGRNLGPAVAAVGYALVGGWHAMVWVGERPILVLPAGIAFAVLGAWSFPRQPRATLFVLFVGLASLAWVLPAFPVLCIGLLLAPHLRREPARPGPGPGTSVAPGKIDHSDQACPVCGEHRLRAVTPPRIDVQGVAPWLDLYAMGDPRPDTPPAIVCDACGADWPDLAAFGSATPSAARVGRTP